MRIFRITAVAALGLAVAAPAPGQPSGVTISLYSFGYSPRPIILRPGVPVTLTFVNRSGSGHDFTAKRFFASSRILSGSVPDGELEFRGGETKTVRLVPARGTYKAHCSHFLHAQMGMTDRIVVN